MRLALALALTVTTASPATAAREDWLVGTTAHDGFGAALALGDADGDGYGDLLVGSPLAGQGSGKITLYRGGPAGLSHAPHWLFVGSQNGAHLGAVLASLGDVNGDGFADFAVGEPAWGDAASALRGRVFVFYGAADGRLIERARLTGPAAGARLGEALLGPGDLDADGFADLLVGAPGAHGGAGLVRAYRGGPGTFAEVPSWDAPGAPGAAFGATLARAWDVNDDDRADFLAGGPAGLTLYHGGVLGGATAIRPADPDEGGVGDLDGDGTAELARGDAFGFGVARPAPAGDVDADGVPDAWVLTDRPDTPLAVASGRDRATLARVTCATCPAGAVTARGVAFGDLDGDGASDALFGASGLVVGGEAVGATAITYGAPRVAPLELASWPSAAGDPSGASAALGAAGDVDGDGFGDLLVPAPGGELLLVHGGPEDDDDTLRVTPLGVTASAYAAADLDGDGATELVLAGDDEVLALGVVGRPAWRFALAPGAGPGSWLAAGDFDGDGHVDLAVGAAAHLGRPAAFGFRGAIGGPRESPTWTDLGAPLALGAPRLVAVGATDATLGAELWALDDAGRMAPVASAFDGTLPTGLLGPGGVVDVGAAGDLDGDGFGDVVVRLGDGRWEVRAGGVSQKPDVAPLLAGKGAALGVGDVDRDGRDDLLVFGASGASVVWGGAARPGLSLPGDAVRVAAAGDVDGDGAAEVLVDDGREVHLLSFVEAGRLGLGVRASDVGDRRPVGSEAATRTRGAFAVDARVTALHGGRAVGLEVQVAPVGTPLGAGAVTRASALDVLAEARVEAEVAGLGDGVAHRVRVRLRAPLAMAPIQATTPWVAAGTGPRPALVVTRPLWPPEAREDVFHGTQWMPIVKLAQDFMMNDVIPLGDEVRVLLAAGSGVRHGTLTLLETGVMSYTPAGGFWGRDGFRYRLEGEGGASEAEVALVVEPRGMCHGYRETPCRAGRFDATVRTKDGTLRGVRCWREEAGLRCATDAHGRLVLGPAPCAELKK